MALDSLQLAETQALRVMNFGNSSLSPKANRLLSLLEGAEGTLSLREQITAYLDTNYSSSPSYDEDELQKRNSIKSKVAYLVSLNTTSGGTRPFDRDAIIKNVDDYLESIDKDILQKEDFSESTVIRMSALRNFDIKLSPSEKLKLATIVGKLKDLVKDDKNLTADLNLSQENDTQKIYKLKVIINSLAKAGKTPGDDVDIASFQTEFESKLDPLRELDKHYHNVNEARNIFYRIQRTYGRIKVLSKKEEDKIQEILQKVSGEDLITHFNNKFYAGEDGSRVLNFNNLETELNRIKGNTSFKEEIDKINLKESEFSKYYLAYFSQKILKQSKVDFDNKKTETFGDRTRDFDSGIHEWRNKQRQRLIELCGDIDRNLTSLENIFDRDRKIFLLDGNVDNPTHEDNLIIAGLRAIIGNRYNGLNDNQQEVLLRALLSENKATNELYYSDTNNFNSDKDDSGFQNFLKRTGKSGRGIKNVEKFTTPLIRGFAKFGKGTLEFTSKKTSEIVNGTTSRIHNLVSGIDSSIASQPKSTLGKIVKFPFQSALILTKPAKWTTGLANLGVNKSTGFVGETYDFLNTNLKNASDGKIDDIFDIFTKTYSTALSLAGGGVELTGDGSYNFFKTIQKREILQDFYSTRNTQEVRNILESIDIQSKLRDSSPYIFDEEEDDLVLSENKSEKKEDMANTTFKNIGKKITKLKEKAERKLSSSQNEHIKEFMEELKEKLEEWEETANNNDSFEDKVNDMRSVMENISSYIVSIKAKIEDDIKIIHDKSGSGSGSGKIPDLDAHIRDINSQISSISLTSKGIGSQVKLLTESRLKLQKRRDDLEKELTKLQGCKSLLDMLDGSNFKGIIDPLKDSSSGQLYVLGNQYNAGTFTSSNYKTASDNLIKEIKKISIP